MEIHILDMIQNLRTPIGDVVVPLITRLGDAGIIWIILTVLLLIIPKTRKTGVIMMAALLVDVLLCNVFIKNLVARTRPFDVNTAVQLLVAKPQDYSFPSGHTAASFASVTALYLAGEKKMWKVALVLAVLIALSRLYLYVHYPTDIIGGVIFGSLSEGPDALWRERLRVFGQELGEFIYIMDAVLDLEGDRAGGRYNAVAAFAEGKTEDDLRYTLTMLIGECAAVFERLPVVRDADIMRNILYSGVWLRYNMEMARRHGKEGGEPVES